MLIRHLNWRLNIRKDGEKEHKRHHRLSAWQRIFLHGQSKPNIMNITPPRTLKRVLLKMLETRAQLTQQDFLTNAEIELNRIVYTVDWYAEHEKMLAPLFLKITMLEFKDAISKIQGLRKSVAAIREPELQEQRIADMDLYMRLLQLIQSKELRLSCTEIALRFLNQKKPFENGRTY